MAFVRYAALDGKRLARTWDAVSKALDRLERSGVGSLSLGLSETGDDTFLIVVPVKSMGVHVSVRTMSEEEEHHLVDATKPSDLAECIVGGVEQVLSLDSVVDLQQAREVIRHYFETGERLEQASWGRTLERYERLARGESIRKR
ncbi:Imm1 family immunity protein [Hyalangium versicolor]|uniref:Imm1 family immunity protein n=1 Tax=Hyalangium versicolor TaxID=2861190 RepID=UPI001CCAB356|nr:Imm1 family immunity protein [Hyalangium versicolor]